MTPRPDRIPFASRGLRTSEQRAFTRAAIATLLGDIHAADPLEIAERTWPGERVIPAILQRGTSTTATSSTTGWAAEVAGTKIADFLFNVGAPTAMASLLRSGTQVTLQRNKAVIIPFILNDGAGADFIAENTPIPVKNFNFSAGVTLGLKRFAVLVPFTRQVFELSMPSLESIVDALVGEAVYLKLDTIAFDNAAATAVRPAGLLYNANAALTATAAGPTAHLEDVSKLVGAVSKVSSGAPIALVASPGQAARLRLDPGVAAAHVILSSPALAAKTVCAVATKCLGVAQGEAQIDTATHTAFHMADPATELVTGGVVSTPLRSFYQSNSVALKLIFPIDFALRSADAFAYMTAVAWGAQS